MRAFHKPNALVSFLDKICFIGIQHFVIYAFLCFLCMKFTIIPVFVFAFEVIDSVGHITCLLNFD